MLLKLQSKIMDEIPYTAFWCNNLACRNEAIIRLIARYGWWNITSSPQRVKMRERVTHKNNTRRKVVIYSVMWFRTLWLSAEQKSQTQ